MSEKCFQFEGVPETGVSQLKDKVKKLNKRALKIGVPEMEIEVFNERYRKITEDYKGFKLVNPYYIKIWDVNIYGETPQYDGYKFVAVITGYPSGDNVIHKSPFLKEDVDVTEYRNKKSFCDHCKTRRFRKNTYLIADKENNLFQVGSQCIKDFLGHSAPGYSLMVKAIKDLEDIETADFYSDEICKYENINGFLPMAVEVINRYGFVSRKNAEMYGKPSTVDTIHYIRMLEYQDKLKSDREFHDFEVTDESVEMAKNIAEWGRELQNRGNLNDYMYTLSIIFKNELVDVRSYGYVAASVNTYKNEKGMLEEKKRKFDPKKSEYYGEVKKRYELEVTLTKILDFASDWGQCQFHIFYDDDNNQFVWYANNTHLKLEEGVDIGDKIKIKGTVKKHKEYNDIKQTVLNRVTALEMIKKGE